MEWLFFNYVIVKLTLSWTIFHKLRWNCKDRFAKVENWTAGIGMQNLLSSFLFFLTVKSHGVEVEKLQYHDLMTVKWEKLGELLTVSWTNLNLTRISTRSNKDKKKQTSLSDFFTVKPSDLDSTSDLFTTAVNFDTSTPRMSPRKNKRPKFVDYNEQLDNSAAKKGKLSEEANSSRHDEKSAGNSNKSSPKDKKSPKCSKSSPKDNKGTAKESKRSPNDLKKSPRDSKKSPKDAKKSPRATRHSPRSRRSPSPRKRSLSPKRRSPSPKKYSSSGHSSSRDKRTSSSSSGRYSRSSSSKQHRSSSSRSSGYSSNSRYSNHRDDRDSRYRDDRKSSTYKGKYADRDNKDLRHHLNNNDKRSDRGRNGESSSSSYSRDGSRKIDTVRESDREREDRHAREAKDRGDKHKSSSSKTSGTSKGDSRDDGGHCSKDADKYSKQYKSSDKVVDKKKHSKNLETVCEVSEDEKTIINANTQSLVDYEAGNDAMLKVLTPRMVTQDFAVWWIPHGYPWAQVYEHYVVIQLHLANCVKSYNKDCIQTGATFVRFSNINLIKVIAGAIFFLTSNEFERQWLMDEADIIRDSALISTRFRAVNHIREEIIESPLNNIFLLKTSVNQLLNWDIVMDDPKLKDLKYRATKDDWYVIKNSSNNINGLRCSGVGTAKYLYLPTETAKLAHRMFREEGVQNTSSAIQYSLLPFREQDIGISGLHRETVKKYCNKYNCVNRMINYGFEMPVFIAACEQDFNFIVRKPSLDYEAEMMAGRVGDAVNMVIGKIDVTDPGVKIV